MTTHIHVGVDKQTHQQFVDDIMLMGHPSVQESRAFKRGLEIFSKAFSLEINNEKSQVFLFNTPRITQRNILCILGFLGISLPSKYLVVPFAEGIIQ